MDNKEKPGEILPKSTILRIERNLAALKSIILEYDSIENWNAFVAVEKDMQHLRSLLDRVMIEHCPDEMSESQLEEFSDSLSPSVNVYLVEAIDWDTDGKTVSQVLPFSTVIEAESKDFVVDRLSDKYGFCIHSVGSIARVV